MDARSRLQVVRARHPGHRRDPRSGDGVVVRPGGRARHPRHVRAADRLRRRPPQLQPPLHAADLPGLGALDVVGQLAQLGVGRVVALPRRHLDGLLVVHAHVLQEPDVHRLGRGHLGTPARPMSSPPVAPTSRSTSAAATMTNGRTQRGFPRLPRAPAAGFQRGHLAGSGVTPCAPAMTSGITRGVVDGADRRRGRYGGGLSWSNCARPERGAARPRLGVLVLVAAQRLDELVDPRVVRVRQLQLVAPRLQRDRLVEAGVGRHQAVRLPVDLRAQRLQRVTGDLVRVVGDPHRAVLERVHHVLAAHRGGVDDAVARRPVAVVRAAERRAVRVRDASGWAVRGWPPAYGWMTIPAILADGSLLVSDGVHSASAAAFACLALFWTT